MCGPRLLAGPENLLQVWYSSEFSRSCAPWICQWLQRALPGRPPVSPTPVVVPPRATKAQKRAWKQQQRDTPASVGPRESQLDWDAMLQVLTALGPSEDVVGQVRAKIPPPVLVEKKVRNWRTSVMYESTA